jgi:mycobactin lysine-N-oxygenase
MAKRLCVVGAGPKAAAIVARAAVLRDVAPDRDVPEIVVVERDEVGAAWSGAFGFSSGFLTLCSPPERDVGFPYVDFVRRLGRVPLAQPLFGRFSWSAFLVATGRYAEWVDRDRGYPSHRSWAQYLRWVFEQARQPILRAEVTSIEPAAGKPWLVRVRKSGGDRFKFETDGVVLTGAGKAKLVPLKGVVPADRVYDAESFWAARDRFAALDEATIAVVGDGGAAGTIVAWLADRLGERRASIISISPAGTLLPRGDGYAERRWFSDPSEWIGLSEADRRRLLERTESGVVSLRLKSIIDQASNVGYRAGRAVSAEWDGQELRIELQYAGRPADPVGSHYLVNAIGFDPWTLLEPVKGHLADRIRNPVHSEYRLRVESLMEPDLSLPRLLGNPGGLHIPVLAGFAHGPGMGTLGSLGLMSSAVLDRYLAKP